MLAAVLIPGNYSTDTFRMSFDAQRLQVTSRGIKAMRNGTSKQIYSVFTQTQNDSNLRKFCKNKMLLLISYS
jgi:hypothetical protein